MKVAIHQPNYLPWIGFFDKLDQVDTFVLLDTAEYSSSSFVNRNSIKTPQGKFLLTVPLKTKNQPINQTVIDSSKKWHVKHWRVLESNYKKSTYWNDFSEGFQQIYEKEWDVISHVNIALIRYMIEMLEIDTEIVLESELKQDFGTGNTRNMKIVKYLQGTTYVSGIGAKVYNDATEFEENHISLQYQQFTHPVYPQRWGAFISHLSMVDLMFNCGDQSMEMIRKYRKECTHDE